MRMVCVKYLIDKYGSSDIPPKTDVMNNGMNCMFCEHQMDHEVVHKCSVPCKAFKKEDNRWYEFTCIPWEDEYYYN